MPNNGINLYFHPDEQPDPHKETTRDPLEGFDGGRKERVMHATKAELESAKVHPSHRDYCSHYLLNYRKCRKDNWPFPVNCEHEKHEYLHCQYDDYIMRMKEYERERRMMVRDKKLGITPEISVEA